MLYCISVENFIWLLSNFPVAGVIELIADHVTAHSIMACMQLLSFHCRYRQQIQVNTHLSLESFSACMRTQLVRNHL